MMAMLLTSKTISTVMIQFNVYVMIVNIIISIALILCLGNYLMIRRIKKILLLPRLDIHFRDIPMENELVDIIMDIRMKLNTQVHKHVTGSLSIELKSDIYNSVQFRVFMNSLSEMNYKLSTDIMQEGYKLTISWQRYSNATTTK